MPLQPPGHANRKCPSTRHWEELSRLSEVFMSPQEFLSFWDISLKELAQIIGVAPNTVHHWLARNPRSQPQPHHLFKLALIHKRWSRL